MRSRVGPAVALTLGLALLPGCQGSEPARSEARPTSASSGGAAADGPSPVSPAVDTIRVGDGPVGLALGARGAVWVVSAGADRVSRVPAGASKPDLVVAVPGTPLRAVEAYGALWVTAFAGERLVRVDTATGRITDRVPTGAGPEGVTAAFGSVWVVGQDSGTLLSVDPRTMAVTKRIGIGVGARLVTADRGFLYVSHYADGQVLRIDPRTGHVRRSPKVCNGPQGLAVTHGRLWLACTRDSLVLVLDARTLGVVSRLRAPPAPDPVTVAPSGTVLSVSQSGPTVVGIDADTREPVSRQVLGTAAQLYDEANVDAVVAAGEVWVTSFTGNAVLRAPLP